MLVSIIEVFNFIGYFSKNVLASAGLGLSCPCSGLLHIRILNEAHSLSAAQGVGLGTFQLFLAVSLTVSSNR